MKEPNELVDECCRIYNRIERHKQLSTHLMVSGIETYSGRRVFGTNVPKSGIICAEMVALANVLIEAEPEEARYLVTVCKQKDGFVFLLPCGNCRQNLSYICPQVKIVFKHNGIFRYQTLRTLLPSPFIRGDK